MMGDNRDNSSDSRFPSVPGGTGVGYVPFENLVGPAKIIFFSVTTGENGFEVWKWPWIVRWARLLHLT
jgi:signal peptidase I